MSLRLTIHFIAWSFSVFCVLPSFAFASQCQMQLEEALRIVRQTPWGKDIDDPQRVVSGAFFTSVPRERISGWNDPERADYVSKMIEVLKGKQVWVIDATLIPATGVRGWNLQFFVDACERRLLDASPK